MKTVTILIIVIAALLLPFRERIAALDRAKRLYMLGRFAYVGIAALWWLYLGRDADHINVPKDLYVALPVAVLLLYAIVPNIKSWLLVILTLCVGWGLHLREELFSHYAHLGVKEDFAGIIVDNIIYFLILTLCISVLYILGPLLQRKAT